MSLAQKLNELSAGFSKQISQEVADIMGRNTEALVTASRSAQIPKVGEPFPEFELADSQGQSQSRATLAADQPLIISFFRGFW